MAGGRAAPGCAGGGEDIQAPRPGRARLATAAGALLVACAVAGSPVLGRPGHQLLLLGLGAVAVVPLAVGLALRWNAALTTALALLGAEQAVRLVTGPDAVDPWTPLYAGALLLTAELAWWSVERRVPASAEPGTALRRLATVGAACAAGSGLSAFVVLAAGAPLEGGLALELVGVVAASAALAVVAGVARTRVG